MEEERGTIVRCFIVCIGGKKSDGVQRSMGAQGWAVSIREGGRTGAQSRRCGITCNDSANMRGVFGAQNVYETHEGDGVPFIPGLRRGTPHILNSLCHFFPLSVTKGKTCFE